MSQQPTPIAYEHYDKRYVDNFLSECREWLGPRIRKVTSYLAMKVDGAFVLLIARVRYESVLTLPEPVTESFQSERLMVGTNVQILKNANPEQCVYEEIYNARIVLPNITLSIPHPDQGHGKISTYPVNYGDEITDNVTPRICGLRIRGKDFNRLEPYVFNSSEINWELKSASTPYYDINDVLRRFGLGGLVHQSSSAFIELVVIPQALMSRDSGIAADNITVDIIASPAIDKSKISVGLLAHGKSIDRLSLDSDAIEWKTAGDNLMGTIRHHLEGIVFTQVFLRYKGQAIDQMMLINPNRSFNPATELYKLIDHDKSNLINLLSGVGDKRAIQFEAGVTILLHLHGFRALHVGKKLHWAEGASDLMAITPGGNVLIVECTTGLLDNGGKLAKLYSRMELARGALAAANMEYLHVIPVIVSSRTREETHADIEEAARLKISVLCRADIDQLVSEIATTPNPESLYQRFLRMIPPQNAGQGPIRSYDTDI